MASEFEKVELIDETYQFVPAVSAFGYLRRETVSGNTTVDGWNNREMYYHRLSFAAVSGATYEVLEEIPFGLACVSGY